MGGSRGGFWCQNPPSATRGNIFYKWPYAFPVILNEWSGACKVWNLQLRCRENATSGFLILKIFSGMSCDYPFFSTSDAHVHVYLRGHPHTVEGVTPTNGVCSPVVFTQRIGSRFMNHFDFKVVRIVFPIKVAVTLGCEKVCWNKKLHISMI